MRFALFAPVFLLACGVGADDPVEAEPDDAVLAGALPGLSPQPLVDLAEDPRLQLGVDPQCGGPADLLLADPAVDGAPTGSPSADPLDRLSADPDGPVTEAWSSACDFGPGVELDGSLTWTHGPDGAVLVGDRAVLRRDGVVELALDGAIELLEQGDLLLVDAAASWCGPGGPACDADALTVDLSFSLFPADGYPTAYDVTVSGVVGTVDSLVSVEGVWSVDDAACPEEPANGVVALRSGERHALELDGAERCDGCAGWSVQGLRAPAWCGLDL